MCNLINTHTHTPPHRHKHTSTAYSRPRSSTMSNAFASGSAFSSLVRDYTEEELAESCSSSSSESFGSEVEIEKVQPSASSAGGGGGAAGSGGARAASVLAWTRGRSRATVTALQHPLFSSTTEGEGNSSLLCWRYRVSCDFPCDLKYLYFINSIICVRA